MFCEYQRHCFNHWNIDKMFWTSHYGRVVQYTRSVTCRQTGDGSWRIVTTNHVCQFATCQRSSVLLHTSVIHLHVPAHPTSQTHKFPKGHTNLVPHASIWTQKNYNYDYSLLYVFYSLDRASDRIRRYRTAYFTNSRIHIIRAFFHIKQKIVPY